MLNDVLFFASVLTFSAAAILGYWQLLRVDLEEREEPVAASSEPDFVPEPVPATV